MLQHMLQHMLNIRSVAVATLMSMHMHNANAQCWCAITPQQTRQPTHIKRHIP
jgi:hypothetical protein